MGTTFIHDRRKSRLDLGPDFAMLEGRFANRPYFVENRPYFAAPDNPREPGTVQ